MGGKRGNEVIHELLKRALRDKKISPSDFKLFYCLIYLWTLKKCPRIIAVKRDEIMEFASIGSKTTYHKAIAKLTKAMYINYTSTFHPGKSSLIEIFL